MACSSCSANIEKKLNTLKGVNSASVSLPGRSALIDFDPQVISLEKMKAEINALGYDLVIDKETSVEEIEKREYVLLKRKDSVVMVVLNSCDVCVYAMDRLGFS